MNLNKVFLIGRLVQDVDFKITPTGTPLAVLNIATNRIYKDRNNQAQQETEYHRVIAWGKLAETCRDYLNKGRLLFIEGRLHYRTWLSQDGTKRTQTEIIAENIRFGPKGLSEEVPEELDEFKEEKENHIPPDIWEISF
ncbi:MAG: single-stranded DNA-binding protein [Minisyncoccia bacterium]